MLKFSYEPGLGGYIAEGIYGDDVGYIMDPAASEPGIYRGTCFSKPRSRLLFKSHNRGEIEAWMSSMYLKEVEAKDEKKF